MSPSYFIVVNRKQIGPFSLEELKSKPIKRDSLVWTEGLNEWTPLEQIPELAELLKTIPPPIPRKSSVSLQSQSTLPLKRVKFFWLGITCLSLLGNLLCAWLIFNRDGFFQILSLTKADSEIKEAEYSAFHPIITSISFDQRPSQERVRIVFNTLKADYEIAHKFPDNFNDFIKKFSTLEMMTKLHSAMISDIAYQDIVPKKFEDAIDWLGLTKAPSPSMKPQN